MNEIEELSEKILEFIREKPIYFYDVLVKFRNEEYKKILLAWGKLRSEKKLSRDEKTGMYKIREV
jgi:hypothetical protein